MSNPSTRAVHSSYFSALDGIRFICAAWVMVSHVQLPTVMLWNDIRLSLGPWFNGGWAVMIFFVISGFCIHYSYHSGRPLAVGRFYMARAIRIVLPMLIAMMLSYLMTGGLHWLNFVLWSLYCEIIYYAIYPPLFLMFKKTGVVKPLVISYCCAFGLAAFPDQHNGYFWSYGLWGTALLGLPPWILGCTLAESMGRRRLNEGPFSEVILLYLRLTILIIGILTLLLEVATPLKFKYSFLICSPLIYAWLYAELSSTRNSPMLEKLKGFGRASYSLYLVHIFSIPLIMVLAGGANQVQQWELRMAAVVVLATLFFVVVERPAHRLAKRVGAP